MARKKIPSRSFDWHCSVPPGYVTAAQLAAAYKRSEPSVKFRMRYDHVPSLRVKRRNADGLALGGREICVYLQSAAHAAMQRPKQRTTNGSSPGYVGVLANVYKLTRCQVRDILAAAGVEAQQRICPCCGKSTLFYPKRSAACAALNAWQRTKQTNAKAETTRKS